jgi:hypothetical protein
MPITKKSGRQQVISAYVDFVFGDVSPSGVGQAAIDLPVGAQVVGGDFVISQAFNSATSDTFTIGDATLATRYGNAISGAAARTALTLTGFQHTSAEPRRPQVDGRGRGPDGWCRPPARGLHRQQPRAVRRGQGPVIEEQPAISPGGTRGPFS